MLWMSRNFFNLFKPVINKFLETRWNLNWPRAKVFFEIDTRTGLRKWVCETFECTGHNSEFHLKQAALDITKDCHNDDERAFAIFDWTVKNIRYLSDYKNYLKRDYWGSPDEVYERRVDDCESGSILMMKLMEFAGIPAFRRKVCVGNTTVGYHAYVIYLKELRNEWHTLDWCLYPSLSGYAWANDIPHKIDNKLYTSLDFTFNEVNSWSQRDILFRYNMFMEV